MTQETAKEILEGNTGGRRRCPPSPGMRDVTLGHIAFASLPPPSLDPLSHDQRQHRQRGYRIGPPPAEQGS